MCLTRVVLVVFLAAGLIMQAVQSDASPQSASRRSASPQSASQQYWTLQAQVVTDAVLKDAIDLAPLDRALLFGRLAEIWRLKDTSRAPALLQKAITEIEFNPNAESDVARSKALSA